MNPSNIASNLRQSLSEIKDLSRKHPEQARNVYNYVLQNNGITQDELNMGLQGRFEGEDRARNMCLAMRQAKQSLKEMNGERQYFKPKAKYDPMGGPSVNTNNPNHNSRYLGREQRRHLSDTRKDKQERTKAKKAGGFWR